MDGKHGGVPVQSGPELPGGHAVIHQATQKLGVSPANFAQKFFSKRKVLVKEHLEVDTIDAGICVDECPAGQKALFNAREEIAGRVVPDILERLLEFGNRVAEEILEQARFVAEILEKRSLCDAQTVHDAIDGRLVVAVLREFAGSFVQDAGAFFVRQVLEGLRGLGHTACPCAFPGLWLEVTRWSP